MSSSEIVVDVRNLSKRYEIYESPRDRLKQMIVPPLYEAFSNTFARNNSKASRVYFREFWALKDVSFQLRQGETMGIIGKNGSGKSTLLQLLAGTLTSTSGTAVVNGRVAALLELGSGFNPEFNGKDNVFLNGRILGLSHREIEERYDEIVSFADIGDFINQPVKTYSSGMFVRLAFAVQAHIDASIVIIDEALAVGDVFFRQKCYARLEQLKASGAAILLVTHSMPDVEQFCDHGLLLDNGSMSFLGTAIEASKRYYLLHQTKAKATTTETYQKPASQAQDDSNEQLFRPDQRTFLDLDKIVQISDGQAHCSGIALMDTNGAPRNSFYQGERAFFYSEFIADQNFGVPIFGMIIKNDRGIIVHGKNTWQAGLTSDLQANKGCLIRCQYELELCLGPGEYTYELGLTYISLEEWRARDVTSHEKMSALYEIACSMPDAGFFSIGLMPKNEVLTLSHHGIADLPGKMSLSLSLESDTEEASKSAR
jgi:lipopolysaccharide transport system ATP-binding protein